MSIDRLRAHYGFTRMPFGNYADGAAMPTLSVCSGVAREGVARVSA